MSWWPVAYHAERVAAHITPSPDSAQPGDDPGAWWEPLVARDDPHSELEADDAAIDAAAPSAAHVDDVVCDT